jgi:hypothetical protein
LSKLENGQKPLTVQVLKKYLTAFYEIGKETSNHLAESLGVFPLEDQLEFTRDLFDQTDKIEINLSGVSIAHRDNITRFAAILAVDDFFPMDILDSRFISWIPANKAIKHLEEAPQHYKPGPFEFPHRFEGGGYYKNRRRD